MGQTVDTESQSTHAQNAAIQTLSSPVNQRSLPLNQRLSNADFSGEPLSQRMCFSIFSPFLCAVTGVVEIWFPHPTVQGTLQQSSGGVTGP